MKPFTLVYGREATPTLDAMLPKITDEDDTDVAAYLSRAEDARRLTRRRIKGQQRTDATTYADATRNISRVTVCIYGRPFASVN